MSRCLKARTVPGPSPWLRAALALAAAWVLVGCGDAGFDLEIVRAAMNPDSKTGESRFTVSIKPTGAATDEDANGFLLQKVVADFMVYQCADCDCETFKKISDRSLPCEKAFVRRVVYVEAWELASGTLYHGLKASDDKDPQDTFATGDFSDERPTRVCGVNSISGEMKFVAGSPPKDLDPSQWKPEDKAPQSGRLPSTLAVAPTRAFDALEGSVVKGRRLSVLINSCSDPETFQGSLQVNRPKGEE